MRKGLGYNIPEAKKKEKKIGRKLTRLRKKTIRTTSKYSVKVVSERSKRSDQTNSFLLGYQASCTYVVVLI